LHPAQLAIAWVLSRRPFIVPIPGTAMSTASRKTPRCGPQPIGRPADALEHIFAPGIAAGARYPAATSNAADLKLF